MMLLILMFVKKIKTNELNNFQSFGSVPSKFPPPPPPPLAYLLIMPTSLKPSLPQQSQRQHFMYQSCLIAEDSSSFSDESSNVLSFRDCLAGTRMLLALEPDGILQSPKQLYALIMRPLELINCHKWLFAHHRRQQALPPLGCVVAECSPCGRVRLMFPCVAFACQRLATASADMRMAHLSWSWAESVMERVTRGRVRRVQVRLQRRACCAVRCACRASACVRCAFDACCRKRWLVFRT
jgi:hypothetical protein